MNCFLTCICIVVLKYGFIHANQQTYEYGDCQADGASYTYGNFVICYWIDYMPLQHGTTHCGDYDYAWVPDSGANDILYQLALTRGTANIMYHIGYTINYNSTSEYTVIREGNGEQQNYSAFISAMDTTKTCVGFKDGHWDAILFIDFNYGDCRENGVSYIDGVNLYCYWIDSTQQQSTNACGLDYSVIPDLEAQRVVNWLIKVRNLSHAGTYYHIGYKENPSGSNVKTHNGVLQDWMNWDVNEPIDNNLENCVIIKQPYGLWKDYTCTLSLMSICSTVRKVETSQTTTEVITTPEVKSSDSSTSTLTTTVMETTTNYQKVEETTTLSPSGTTFGLCICACSLVANITIDIEQRIEELKKS
ncbi:unnamed protein product [Mytilus edulis]|uniref:C-type lectin domain-containing protein n=1 Tax=Mytilus edulis TaxID=6550 RepID=A0A8S3Q2Q9_MYTED|nr:unnamed protein product [Mytilus edulis]